MVANMRNIVTETIAYIFLLVLDEILNPNYFTTEPCEHTFGSWRSQKIEATFQDCVELEDKRRRKVNAICDISLAVSCSP